MPQTRIETRQDIEIVRAAWKKFLKECEDLGWEPQEVVAWVGLQYDKMMDQK